VVGYWDAARLERVVGNLLANARAYSPAGGPILVTVTRECTPDGSGWAVLRVEDHGVGIPAADLPHIGEPFYRASNVRGRLPGSGLGLSGCRRIVEQHGGTLRIDSREGAGTTVTVRVPLGPGMHAEAGAQPEPSGVVVRRRRAGSPRPVGVP
jgi:signal transduction histidine kinase